MRPGENKLTFSGSSEPQLKVLYVSGKSYNGQRAIYAAMENGVKVGYHDTFKSRRTGTEYRVINQPTYLDDAFAIGGYFDIEMIRNYYRQRPDFDSNEKMQKVCRGEARLINGPMYFVSITVTPFRGDPKSADCIDELDRFDVEVNDELIKY